MLFKGPHWICLVVLIACFSPLVFSEDEKCPAPVNIEPCVCDLERNRAEIACSNIVNLDVLQQVFNKSDEPFPNFSLLGSNLTYLPSRALNQKGINKLLIRHSTLMTLFEQQPEENHQVYHFEWIRSRLMHGVLWDQLKPLKTLRILDVESCSSILEVGKAFEQSIPSTLEEFTLFQTPTEKFSPTLFRKLINLKSVEIAFTKLSVLKRTMFPEENKLRELTFRYNSIKSLPDDVFSNMPYIREVSLEGNSLKIFPEVIFNQIVKGSYYARRINVKGNPISCDCSFKWFVFKRSHVIVEGQCYNPVAKRGKNFGELSLEDFSYCPNNLLSLFETSIEAQQI